MLRYKRFRRCSTSKILPYTFLHRCSHPRSLLLKKAKRTTSEQVNYSSVVLTFRTVSFESPENKENLRSNCTGCFVDQTAYSSHLIDYSAPTKTVSCFHWFRTSGFRRFKFQSPLSHVSFSVTFMTVIRWPLVYRYRSLYKNVSSFNVWIYLHRQVCVFWLPLVHFFSFSWCTFLCLVYSVLFGSIMYSLLSAGAPNGCFCWISVLRSKYCLKFSITSERLKIYSWLFHSCTIFEAYLACVAGAWK